MKPDLEPLMVKPRFLETFKKRFRNGMLKQSSASFAYRLLSIAY